MMPVLDGFSLAHKMENINGKTPFLFVTARKTKEDRLKGLKLGADDYIVKPFEVEELILRIKNIIKRTEQQTLEFKNFDSEIIAIGKYQFDFKNLELTYGKDTVKLTEKEAQLIAFFFEHKNQLIPRDLILAKVWNKSDFFSGRSMDVFISRVRKLFKDDTSIAITSVRGIGLEFNIDK
jgi:DNA-binding response OmpR family regulator